MRENTKNENEDEDEKEEEKNQERWKVDNPIRI